MLKLGAKVLALSQPWGAPGTVVRIDGGYASVAWPAAGLKVHAIGNLVSATAKPTRPHAKEHRV